MSLRLLQYYVEETVAALLFYGAFSFNDVRFVAHR